MYRFYLITVGTLKEPYWKAASDEYIRRLAPYAKVSVTELPETRFSSSRDRARVVKTEGERIIRGLPRDAFLVALTSDGAPVSSEEFAEMIRAEGERGKTICFIIGGPLGLDATVLNRVARGLSLSHLTFTHRLARIIVLEQLYRATTILHNKTYHY